MFTAALFITAPSWKPCRYPSMDETNYGISIYGILLSNQKEWTVHTCNDLDRSQENYDDWKKIISEAYILYDSIYITFLKWQNYRKWLVGARDWVGEGNCGY